MQNSAVQLSNHTNLFGLTQVNYFTNKCSNTLDLAFCNFSVAVNICESPLVAEDAFHTTLIIDASDITLPPLKKQTQTKNLYKRANYDAINTDLATMSWNDLLTARTVDDASTVFYKQIRTVISKHVPRVTIIATRKYPVWYSQALIKIIKEKSKVHARWKQYKNPLDYDEFYLLRSRQKRVLKECHLNYLKRSQNAIKSNPKML